MSSSTRRFASGGRIGRNRPLAIDLGGDDREEARELGRARHDRWGGSKLATRPASGPGPCEGLADQAIGVPRFAAIVSNLRSVSRVPPHSDTPNGVFFRPTAEALRLVAADGHWLSPRTPRGRRAIRHPNGC